MDGWIDGWLDGWMDVAIFLNLDWLAHFMYSGTESSHVEVRVTAAL